MRVNSKSRTKGSTSNNRVFEIVKFEVQDVNFGEMQDYKYKYERFYDVYEEVKQKNLKLKRKIENEDYDSTNIANH